VHASPRLLVRLLLHAQVLQAKEEALRALLWAIDALDLVSGRLHQLGHACRLRAGGDDPGPSSLQQLEAASGSGATACRGGAQLACPDLSPTAGAGLEAVQSAQGLPLQLCLDDWAGHVDSFLAEEGASDALRKGIKPQDVGDMYTRFVKTTSPLVLR
jgi:hypothetical protein